MGEVRPYSPSIPAAATAADADAAAADDDADAASDDDNVLPRAFCEKAPPPRRIEHGSEPRKQVLAELHFLFFGKNGRQSGRTAPRERPAANAI